MGPNENTRTARMAATVFAAIAILWTADVTMARVERAERQNQAHGYWSRGLRLLGAGHAPEAEDLLRKAHAMERANPDYGLDLATALTAGAKFDDAGDLLDDLLNASPNDGPTNLAAARLSVRRGRVEDAKAYYHRAIYGVWRTGASRHRVETRLELANLLDSVGAATELLAELLPLEAEVQGNPPEEKRVAALYLEAHSPARAAAAYRALIAADSNDPDVYSGLGEAELASADYSAAASAFRSAQRLQPDNPQIQARLDLAAEMATLDPTLRRLASREKYGRSVRLLQAARDSLSACAPSGEFTGNLDMTEADRLLQQRAPLQVTNEASEDLLALAERIWHARLRACGAAISPEEEPVSRIISALSQ
jgi:tetratricopeptide (TPR) repeat protein